jgi:hypothetical protein
LTREPDCIARGGVKIEIRLAGKSSDSCGFKHEGRTLSNSIRLEISDTSISSFQAF